MPPSTSTLQQNYTNAALKPLSAAAVHPSEMRGNTDSAAEMESLDLSLDGNHGGSNQGN